jgi:single-strand DNA-binding protein
MSNLNKVILLGRAGRDPETRYTQAGAAIVTLSVATSETWKDKASGEKREATEWHNVVFYDRLAEIVGEYVKKGSLILVEGKLRTRKWQDKSGADRYTTEIHAQSMQLVGGKPDRQDGAQQERPAESKQASAPKRQAPAKASGQFDDLDDDIPF